MQNNKHSPDIGDEQLIKLLWAMSAVSKRLAINFSKLAGKQQSIEGEDSNGKNERCLPYCGGTKKMW